MAMSLMFGTQEFGRPYIAPPGVPPALAYRLRDAISNTLKDGALLDEAQSDSLISNTPARMKSRRSSRKCTMRRRT